MDIIEFARLGGNARSKKLTPERRKRIARKASKARWAKKLAAGKQLQAKHN